MKTRNNYLLALVVTLGLTSAPIWAVDLTASGSAPAVFFEDTDLDDADYEVAIDKACVECFDIFNSETGSSPFIIENGADSNLLFLDAAEHIGINTGVPAYTVDAVGDRIRLTNGVKSIMMRADGAETDIEATGASLFLRSGTSGENVVLNPFSTDGNVGVGTTTPMTKLHVQDSTDTQVLVQNSSSATSDQVMFQLSSPGTAKVRFAITANGTNVWTFDNSPVLNQFSISKVGTGVNEFTVNALGDGRFRRYSYAMAHINTSSRNTKTDFEPLDEKAMLAKVAQLPLTQWRYKMEEEGTRHVGPMAEDFQAAFGLSDGAHISTVDASGVALVAIKGLYQMVQEKDVELTALKEQNVKLQRGRDAEIAALQENNKTLSERLSLIEQFVLKQQSPVATR